MQREPSYFDHSGAPLRMARSVGRVQPAGAPWLGSFAMRPPSAVEDRKCFSCAPTLSPDPEPMLPDVVVEDSAVPRHRKDSEQTPPAADLRSGGSQPAQSSPRPSPESAGIGFPPPASGTGEIVMSSTAVRGQTEPSRMGTPKDNAEVQREPAGESGAVRIRETIAVYPQPEISTAGELSGATMPRSNAGANLPTAREDGAVPLQATAERRSSMGVSTSQELLGGPRFPAASITAPDVSSSSTQAAPSRQTQPSAEPVLIPAPARLQPNDSSRLPESKAHPASGPAQIVTRTITVTPVVSDHAQSARAEMGGAEMAGPQAAVSMPAAEASAERSRLEVLERLSTAQRQPEGGRRVHIKNLHITVQKPATPAPEPTPEAAQPRPAAAPETYFNPWERDYAFE